MAMHTCPEVMKVAPTILSAKAASMSMSGATMAASLPPSSSTTGRTTLEAAAITARPVGTPPVNDTMSTPGCDTSISPSSGPEPLTAFTTPGGKASANAAATASTAPGAGGRSLHHDGVAGEQGGQHLVAEHRHRPVERQQRRHHAVGLVDHAGPATAAGERPGGQRLGHERCECTRHPSDGARIELGLPQHLAVFTRQQGRQILRLDGGTGCRRRLGDELGTLVERHRRPRRERGPGCGHGPIELRR